MSQTHVGIVGLGTYLPEHRRTNDWWPQSVVDAWSQKTIERQTLPLTDLTPGQRKVLDALQTERSDPFRGSVERRVEALGVASSDMEVAAARDALNHADLEAKDIDLVISYSFNPDHLSVPNACRVHEQLGLRSSCQSIAIDTVCNTFQSQLSMAHKYIASGSARYVLLTQSSLASPLLPYDEPHSAWYGDAATAVVVGPVSPGRGVLSEAHRTSGYITVVTGTPGQRWHEGPNTFHARDRVASFRMLLTVADYAQEVLGEALQRCGARPEDVDFYASHQATSWFRPVTQEHAGCHQARHVDTFAWTGSLFACNIPMVLATALREGQLRDGDLVGMFSGGSGVTYSALALRWGR